MVTLNKVERLIEHSEFTVYWMIRTERML